MFQSLDDVKVMVDQLFGWEEFLVREELFDVAFCLLVMFRGHLLGLENGFLRLLAGVFALLGLFGNVDEEVKLCSELQHDLGL